MHRSLIEQYLSDEIGRQFWPKLATKDEYAALQTIFLEGDCFDFATALSDLTGWPVYEIQWGTAMPNDPAECDMEDCGIHRVVLHPSGRYLDASGWTSMQEVLVRVKRPDASYQWTGEVDADCGMFAVDYELVKRAVLAFLPSDVGAAVASAEKPLLGASLSK